MPGAFFGSCERGVIKVANGAWPKEEKEGTVSVRKHGEGDLGTFTVEEFVSLVSKEIENSLQQF